MASKHFCLNPQHFMRPHHGAAFSRFLDRVPADGESREQQIERMMA